MEEYVQSIGWPHITLILGIVFLVLFRHEISNFILRIRRVSKDGVHIDNELNPQKTNETSSSNILEHIEIEKSVLLSEVENAIFEDLKNKNLDPISDTTKILVRNLAVTKIYLDHEQSYDSIFGSQIFILKKLNEVSGVGRDSEYLERFFNSLQERYPEEFSKWTVSDYTNFLFARGLITIKDDNYHITDKGQDFLVWLAKSGKSEDKGY